MNACILAIDIGTCLALGKTEHGCGTGVGANNKRSMGVVVVLELACQPCLAFSEEEGDGLRTPGAHGQGYDITNNWWMTWAAA